MSACDRRLAGVVLALREQLGEFRLADVLARCDDPEDVERAKQAGVDAFFDKSDFRESGLAEKLHELISERRAAEQTA